MSKKIDSVQINDRHEIEARFPFNNLSEDQAEALYVLSEECAEVIEACMKILRHGLASCNPLDHNPDSPTNRQHLEKEIGHIHAAVARLGLMGIVSHQRIYEEQGRKAASIGRWLHHA